jgi:Tol biopolymer transport system component
MQTSDTRVLPDTKDMVVQYWAADATQFFVSKPAGDQYAFYSVSLPGGAAHPLGNATPSPSGQYSSTRSNNHGEIRRATDGKVYSLDRKDALLYRVAWSASDKRLAVVLGEFSGSAAYWIEALDPDNGRWTTIVAPQRDFITGVTWLSDGEITYAKYEPAPRTDSNLWRVMINPSTGLPSGAARRRTQWTDLRILFLSASADGSRLYFIRSSAQVNVCVGDLQSHGTRLASLRRLTLEDAINFPYEWTPDSKAVLLGSNRDGQFRIYKQDIDKDAAELITSGPGDQSRPRMSPDGQWVLYFAYETPGPPKKRLMRIPLSGGAAQEILASDDIAAFNCSRTAGGACVLIETPQNAKTCSLLDPLKGRGPKILETTLEAVGPSISPDGQHIAFVLPGIPRNRIRILDLHGAIETEIAASGAQRLVSLEWSADGTGFYCGDMQPDTERLLHVQRNGPSQVLWSQPFLVDLFGIPSPNGRHLATFKINESANVWMVENP